VRIGYYPTDRASEALFGSAIAYDGEFAVVGAPNDNTGFGKNSGSVYIFSKNDVVCPTRPSRPSGCRMCLTCAAVAAPPFPGGRIR
jgi:hypothetical protein